MRFLFLVMLPLIWILAARNINATVPGIFLLPFMSIPRKILSDAASVVSTIRAATTHRPPTRVVQNSYKPTTSIQHPQQQQQQLNNGEQLYKLIEYSPQSFFTTTQRPVEARNPITAPIPQRFVLSEGRVAPLATNHITPQFSNHQPVPLTFPPLSSPPPTSDSYHQLPKPLPLTSISPSYQQQQQHQQQQSIHSTSHFTTSSLEYSFQHGYNNQGPPKKLVKHVSIFVAPPDNSANRQRVQIKGVPEKHVNIIFIKGPDPNAGNLAEVNLPPAPEQKTFVYVLSKEPNGDSQVVVNTPEPPKYNPPDVYFIKYKDGQNNNNNQQQQKNSPTYSQPPVPSPQYQNPEKFPQQQQQQEPQTPQYGGGNGNIVILHNTNPPPPQQHQHEHTSISPPIIVQQQQGQQQHDFLRPPPPPTTVQQQHQNQATNPEFQHQQFSSSNQNFSYTFPTVVTNSSSHPLKRYSRVSADLTSSRATNFSESVHSNSQHDNFIAAEERKIEIGESHCSGDEEHEEHDVSFQSLDVSSEEDKAGRNGSQTSFQSINSNFFRNSEEEKEKKSKEKEKDFTAITRRYDRNNEHKRISSAIRSIFITKKHAPVTGKLALSSSSSSTAVKYNVADRVLVVKNDSYENTFPKKEKVEEKNGGKQVKKYSPLQKEEDEKNKKQGGNENSWPNKMGAHNNTEKSYISPKIKLDSSSSNSTTYIVYSIPAKHSIFTASSTNNVTKVVDRLYQDGYENGNSTKLVPWKYHGFYAYQYAPTMDYKHYGVKGNRALKRKK